MTLQRPRAALVAAAITTAALAAGALIGAEAAAGDFHSALADYHAGRYEAARAQFLALAELGNCSAQFNLAAMALHGQGGATDTGSGAGWLQSAAGNGCGDLVGNRLTALRDKLTADEARTAADIVAHYGPEALAAQGVLNPQLACYDWTPPRAIAVTTAEPPAAARGQQPAMVITALMVGTDGRPRDPEILLAVPGEAFAPAAIEAWLNSTFATAQRGADPLAARLETKTVFPDGARLADAGVIRQARSAAQADDPAAAYLVGLVAMHDSSLGLSAVQAKELVLGAAREGNADAQYWVGSQLRASAPCHPHTRGAVWLRHAADGGNAAAQLLLAADLLAGAPGASQTAQARTLLAQAARSNNYYVRKHVIALLATSPLDAVRDPHAALELASQLGAGPIRTDPQLYETVAAAYAANGDFRNAAAQQQLALQKARELRWDTRTMAQRLDDYRRGTAWRGDLLAAL
jgi:TPR repeat protein